MDRQRKRNGNRFDPLSINQGLVYERENVGRGLMFPGQMESNTMTTVQQSQHGALPESSGFGTFCSQPPTTMSPPPGFTNIHGYSAREYFQYNQGQGYTQQPSVPLFANGFRSTGTGGVFANGYPEIGAAMQENIFNNNIVDGRNENFEHFLPKIPTILTNPSTTALNFNDSVNDGIKPLIDNIVGSMMGNGAYSHFGPSGGLKISSDFRTEELQHARSARSSFSAENMCDVEEIKNERKASPITFVNASGRVSATPSDGNENCSRPQTPNPNKPSYSEILAKSTAVISSGSGSNGAVKGSADSAKKFTSTHRKSEPSISSTSSGNSSTSTSLSSSPVAKPKTTSQSIMGRLFTSTLGKENFNAYGTGTAGGKSSYKTPVTTPTHQKNATAISKEDKKTPQSNGNGGNKGKGKKERRSDFSNALEERVGNGKVDATSAGKTSRGKTTENSVGSVSRNTPTESQPLNVPHVATKSTRTETFNIENTDLDDASKSDSLTDKRENSFYTNVAPSSGGGGRKAKEKERPKSRKEGRNCAVRRIDKFIQLWGASLISAASWLFKLVLNVVTLSFSVGMTLLEDLYSWSIKKALPYILQHFHTIEDALRTSWRKLKQNISPNIWPFRRKTEETNDMINSDDLIAALGPEQNIQIVNADETLKRLLSCKGQDPYTILGVRSDSSDETIRRHYKKQAVQVHPDKNVVVGAEEAFKILGKAFEIIGDPTKRTEYHNKLLEAHAKEQVFGEIGKLLEQLRKKMEFATSSIRCTKCNFRHKKNKTDRPLFAARYCGQCKINHAAREGELWAETTGWLRLSWNYFTCMDNHVWKINEWAKCQKKNLLHIKADSHNVMYRLVSSGGNSGAGNGQQNQQPQQNPNSPEDEWDSLLNDLYKGGGVPGKHGDHFYQKGNGNYPGSSSSNSFSANSRKKKGKRK